MPSSVSRSTTSSVVSPPPTPSTLRQGSTRAAEVRTLQQALTSAGFPVDVDGKFGPKTLAAVKAYQRSHGLTVDGVVGPKTWAALLGGAPTSTQAPTPTSTPASTSGFDAPTQTLRSGAKGAAVVELQTLLAQRGFLTGAADGAFGSGTLDAVKRFQQAAGLTVDGVVGPRTWEALRSSREIRPLPPGQPGPWAAYEAFPVEGGASYSNSYKPKVVDGKLTHEGHHGIDMYAPRGTAIVAPVSGTVVKAKWEDYGGWVVVIRRSDGVSVRMAHLDGLAAGLKPGSTITAGTQVGTMGKSGQGANGVVHMHFSMYRGGDYYDSINPWAYLKAAGAS